MQVRHDPVEEGHKRQLECVRQYMAKKSIPSDLHARVIRYCEFQHTKNRQNAVSQGCDLVPIPLCHPQLLNPYALHYAPTLSHITFLALPTADRAHPVFVTRLR